MGHHEIVKMLLNVGANPDAQDGDGCTPLHNAAFEGHKKAAVALLECEKKANPNLQDIDGNTALHKASYQGHNIICKLLLDYDADIEARDTHGMTPLAKACAIGSDWSHSRCVSLLLDNGARPDADDATLSVPLHRSAYRGTPKILSLLLGAGASTIARDREGYTPLHYAAYSGHLECLQLLLEHGVDPSPFSTILNPLQPQPSSPSSSSGGLMPQGCTPLHLAAGKGHLECMKALVEAHSGVDHQEGKRMRTPMHYAAWKGFEECVQFLINAGADPYARDYKGMTPLDLANRKRHPLNISLPPSEGLQAGTPPPPVPSRRSASYVEYVSGATPHADTPPPESNSATYGYAVSKPLANSSSTSSIGSAISHSSKHYFRAGKEKGSKLLEKASNGVMNGLSQLTPTTTPVGTPSLRTPAHSSSPMIIPAKPSASVIAGSLPSTPLPETRGAPPVSPSTSVPTRADSLLSMAIQVDRYGFVGRDSPDSEHQKKRELTRANKWTKMLRKWDRYADSNRMRGRLLKGVPDCVRGAAWKLLLGVAKMRDGEVPGLPKYHSLLQCTTPHLEQICKDLSRTFPKHILFREKGSVGQTLLYNVLRAFAVYRPEIGYCQGMGFVCALLLMYMEEEDAFWGLSRLLSGYGLEGLYFDDMRGLPEVLQIHDQLMQALLPHMWERMEEKGIIASLYAPQWYITMFLYTLPFPLVLRIWDVFLNEGSIFMFLVGVALMRLSEDTLSKLEFEGMAIYLKFTNGEGEADGKNAFSFPLDPDTLIKTAMSYRHKPK
eukprot:TRINITY_DN8344_c0_g2_i4.p1 TRINITY_DN8344_c0_g2~~TRINITY_DN8344_c0_g2_i4.p1  ORF type:complete len:853 (+),score=214.15 TRINITY_DN8344_c0_g2_i4:220-2559(+)